MTPEEAERAQYAASEIYTRRLVDAVFADRQRRVDNRKIGLGLIVFTILGIVGALWIVSLIPGLIHLEF